MDKKFLELYKAYQLAQTAFVNAVASNTAILSSTYVLDDAWSELCAHMAAIGMTPYLTVEEIRDGNRHFTPKEG